MASAFGYGVGDFIVLLKLANDVRQRFVDDPQQLKFVADAYAPKSVRLTRIADVKKGPQLWIMFFSIPKKPTCSRNCQAGKRKPCCPPSEAATLS
jgi:hypothetical protein